MMGYHITDVVKHLIIINVIVFIGASMLDIAGYLSLFPPTSDYFKPYQLISHMFMHASPSHLLFNMLGLFFLGPYVERYLGEKRFLILYLLSGLGALLGHLAVGTLMGNVPPVVGASGAVYGVVIGFATLFPNMRLQLIFPPIPVKAKYLALFYIVYDLYSGLSGADTNVAHFAHLGGALAGYLIIQYFRRTP